MTQLLQGQITFHIFAAITEFEREIIRERTNAGLASARARGRKGGRPCGISKEAQVKAVAATSLYQQKKSIPEIFNSLYFKKDLLQVPALSQGYPNPITALNKNGFSE